MTPTPTEPEAIRVLRELLQSKNENVRLRAASELLRWERAEEPQDVPGAQSAHVHLPDLPDDWAD